MAKTKPSSTPRRAPLGRARGLGASGHEIGSWFSQQLAAAALIPLSLFLLFTFCAQVLPEGSYDAARAWLQNPPCAVAMLLLLGVAFFHGAHEIVSGLVQDYVHHRGWHLLGLALVKSAAVLLWLIGTLSVLKIFLGA